MISIKIVNTNNAPKDYFMSGVIGFIAIMLLLWINSITHIFPTVWTEKNVPFIVLLIVLAPSMTIASMFALNTVIPRMQRFVRFALVGGLNTLVDIATLNALIIFFESEVLLSFIIFKILSFAVTVSHSYLWNKLWVFKRLETTVHYREYATFVMISILGLCVNVSVAGVSIYLLLPTMDYITAANISALFAAFATIMINYLGYRNIAFKHHS